MPETQTAGITVSTAVLYGGISARLGHRVTDFIPGQNDAFLFGMHLSFLAAAAVSLSGAVLTAVRLYERRLKRKR